MIPKLASRIAMCTIAICASVVEAKPQPAGTYTYNWDYSGNLGLLSLNEESAQREFIESDAWLIGFNLHYSTRFILASGSLEFVGYEDNASFSQQTEDNFGNVETSSSDADGMLLSFAVGPKLHFGSNDDGMIYGQVGAANMFGSERSISNCSDCYSESIEIEGGMFARAGIQHNTGPVALGLSITQYIGSEDLDSSVSFILSSPF